MPARAPRSRFGQDKKGGGREGGRPSFKRWREHGRKA